MTREEAIKYLKSGCLGLNCSYHIKDRCNDDYEVREARKDEALKMAIQSLSVTDQIRWERDVAIEQLREIGLELGAKMDNVKKALEKQIPKKPSEVYEIEDGTFYRLDYMCTACNSATYGQPYRPKYCKHCGQALDWSEEDGLERDNFGSNTTNSIETKI